MIITERGLFQPTLTEQVIKNKEAIENLLAGQPVVADLNIRIVAIVTLSSEIPTVANYKAGYSGWMYGDSYAVGEQPYYTIYTLTKGATTAQDSWTNLGEFPRKGTFEGQLQEGTGIDLSTSGNVTTISVENTIATKTYVDESVTGLAAWSEVEDAIEEEADLREAADNALDTRVDALEAIGRFLSLWNGEVGVAVTNPATSPYTYKTGDYFRVSHAGSRVPTGTQYVIGGTNYETGTANVGDTFYYDGSIWARMQAGSGGTVTDVYQNNVSVVSAGIAQVTVPTKTGDLTNNSGFITKSVSDLYNYTPTSQLATVATSGSYNDLSNKPTIPVLPTGTIITTNNINDYVGPAGLSNDYDDLYNKPTIPSGALASLNAIDYTSSYLTNKPTIPTQTSQLTNNSGFITSSYHDSTKQDVISSSNKLPYSYLSGTPTIPTVNNPTITFTQGGVSKGTITLNQSSNKTIALDAGGGSVTLYHHFVTISMMDPSTDLYVNLDYTSTSSTACTDYSAVVSAIGDDFTVTGYIYTDNIYAMCISMSYDSTNENTEILYVDYQAGLGTISVGGLAYSATVTDTVHAIS